jgi:uncharacterized protein (TIGR03083 family)
MSEEYWAAVRAVRLQIADFLDTLSAEEWEAQSLCTEWRVRDVAGPIALVPTITTWQLLGVAPRAGFNIHRMNTLTAQRAGSAPTQAIVAKLRQHAADRTTARVLNLADSLFDAVVHSQDIARPLGRELAIPVESTRAGLDRVWAMGWPFNAPKKLAGLRLTATDTDWTVGTGPEITGSAIALLLLLTGRSAATIDELDGIGVSRLRL